MTQDHEKCACNSSHHKHYIDKCSFYVTRDTQSCVLLNRLRTDFFAALFIRQDAQRIAMIFRHMPLQRIILKK